MNKNKKIIITIGIILLAFVLLLVSKFQQRKSLENQDILPTRDTEGIQGYQTIEEFCTDLTLTQELNDENRRQGFYQECLQNYSL